MDVYQGIGEGHRSSLSAKLGQIILCHNQKPISLILFLMKMMEKIVDNHLFKNRGFGKDICINASTLKGKQIQ